MNDLNFFINPNANKNKSKIGRILLISIAVLILFIGGLFWVLSIRNNNIETQIQNLEKKLTSPEIVEGLEKYAIVNQQLSLLKQYDQALNTIDQKLSQEDRIKKITLDKIAAAIPPSITLTMIDIKDAEIMLQAISTNETANAELIRNFKDTGLFTSVELISSLKPVDTGAAATDRTLTVHATLKEGMPE